MDPNRHKAVATASTYNPYQVNEQQTSLFAIVLGASMFIGIIGLRRELPSKEHLIIISLHLCLHMQWSLLGASGLKAYSQYVEY